MTYASGRLSRTTVIDVTQNTFGYGEDIMIKLGKVSVETKMAEDRFVEIDQTPLLPI